MDWTTLAQLGMASIIALQMNRKIDQFILETRKSNESTRTFFSRITRALDRHDRRLDAIESVIIEAEEPESVVAGFKANSP